MTLGLHKASTRRAATTVLLWLAGAGLTIEAAQDSAAPNPAPLFGSTDVLQVQLAAPFSKVLRSRGENAAYFPATLRHADAAGNTLEIALQIKTRGNFRNRESICRFPPLMLDFPRAAVAGTLVAGENRLKLVTHCQQRSRYEQYVLLEYLSYRIFNLLSDISLKVRLLELSYVDSDTAKPLQVKRGFLIEDSGRLAARTGLTEVALQRIQRAWYEPRQAMLVAVYQYLVGNTDWSMLIGAPDDICCHNVIALQTAAGDLVPVPYDLDVTGLVNPGYGRPPAALPIRRLTQRLYRGGCPDPDILAEVLATFQQHKAAIVALYENQPELTATVRGRALAFIAQFYAVIDDPLLVESELRRACG